HVDRAAGDTRRSRLPGSAWSRTAVARRPPERPMTASTRGAEVVVIGGGVIGASVAWHLTLHGVRGVIVLDREPTPGAGSTGRATGGYRATFATEPNIRLS